MTETGGIPHPRRTPTGMRRGLSWVGRTLLFLATLVGALYLGAMAIAHAIEFAVSVFAPGLCHHVPADVPGMSIRCSEGLLGTVARLAAQIGELLYFVPVLFVTMSPWDEEPVMSLLSCLPVALIALCIVRAVFVGLRWLDARFHRERAGA